MNASDHQSPKLKKTQSANFDMHRLLRLQLTDHNDSVVKTLLSSDDDTAPFNELAFSCFIGLKARFY
jgi:hypothetical protein